MLYRRKVLLNLLQTFGGSLTSIELQKLVFLFAQQQEKPCYDFVPHKFGGYSFQLHEDCQVLAHKGGLSKDSDIWSLCGPGEVPLLQRTDQQTIQNLYHRFRDVKGDELVRHVYQEHPYFATKSLIAPQLLSDTELQTIAHARPQVSGRSLFTTGYEGLSIDAFLERLLRHGIQHLCDVRRNPLSMKPGFSKGKLSAALQEVEISYSHHPALGIDSESRKIATETKDWEALFSSYQARVSEQKDLLLPDLLDLVQKHERVALMCFEQKSCDCHRGRLVRVLDEELASACPVVHL